MSAATAQPRVRLASWLLACGVVALQLWSYCTEVSLGVGVWQFVLSLALAAVWIILLPVELILLAHMDRPARPVLLRSSLVAVVAVILWPGMLNRLKEGVDRSYCQFNLRQIGQALRINETEYHRPMPPALMDLEKLTDLTPGTLICPSSDDEVAEPSQAAVTSYQYFGAGIWLHGVPADIVIAVDKPRNHAGGANVLFGDGHVEWVDEKRIGSSLTVDRWAATTRPATRAAASLPSW